MRNLLLIICLFVGLLSNAQSDFRVDYQKVYLCNGNGDIQGEKLEKGKIVFVEDPSSETITINRFIKGEDGVYTHFTSYTFHNKHLKTKAPNGGTVLILKYLNRYEVISPMQYHIFDNVILFIDSVTGNHLIFTGLTVMNQ